ncbi:hypothetical protein ES703_09974 [subsurface metagenome]
MVSQTTQVKVAQPFSPVKPPTKVDTSLNSNLMIHHKDHIPPLRVIYKSRGEPLPSPYGVSSSFRVLSPSLFFKKYDRIRDCLKYSLGMTTGQREVALRLLRLWVYYGKVYPKESQVTELPGCSKATFWRTIQFLEELGLVRVVNRYVIRPRAQISNLYRLEKLVMVIARYLAEHGQALREKWLEPYLVMPARLFWSLRFPFGTTSSGGLPLNIT